MLACHSESKAESKSRMSTVQNFAGPQYKWRLKQLFKRRRDLDRRYTFDFMAREFCRRKDKSPTENPEDEADLYFSDELVDRSERLFEQ